MNSISLNNIDPGEVAKFESQASRWWDPGGEFRTLHDINPLRVRYIEERAGLAGRQVIDIGCGGGILAEGMAKKGAIVTAIDASNASLTVAKLHQLQSGTQITYLHTTAEPYAETHPAEYDIVTCLEMLEHVPEPQSVVMACAHLVKPGGHVFFSTLNRIPKAYLMAVAGAEYIMKLLPKGTHDYAKFIRPSELARWIRQAGLSVRELNGMSYNPFNHHCSLTAYPEVNYLIHAQRQT